MRTFNIFVTTLGRFFFFLIFHCISRVYNLAYIANLLGIYLGSDEVWIVRV